MNIGEFIKKLRNERKLSPVLKVSYEELMAVAGYIDNFTIENMTIDGIAEDEYNYLTHSKKKMIDALEKSINKKNEIADDIIQFLIDKGVIKEGEELTDEKRKWLLNLLDKAIDMSRL